MTQANSIIPSQENPRSGSGENPTRADKAAWSTPTLTRLEGKETQGIAPHSGDSRQRNTPEEMIFFGS